MTVRPWKVELLILDVDGVLTDGRVFVSERGEPLKRFHVHDGSAIKEWLRAGGKVAILSGRSSDIVQERAKELGIELVRTGVEDKLAEYEKLLSATGCDDEAVAFVGDDLPDVPVMGRCGFPVAVANAAPTVKRAASYVTRRRGGEGAAAEVVELLLRSSGRWRLRLKPGSQATCEPREH